MAHFLAEEAVDLVCRDNPIVNRAKPSGHDDAYGTGMKETRGMLGQRGGYFEPLELGPEGCSLGVAGIVPYGSGSGRLEMVDVIPDPGNDLLQGDQAFLDEPLLFLGVFFVAEAVPVLPLGIDGSYDAATGLFEVRPGVRVVD